LGLLWNRFTQCLWELPLNHLVDHFLGSLEGHPIPTLTCSGRRLAAWPTGCPAAPPSARSSVRAAGSCPRQRWGAGRTSGRRRIADRKRHWGTASGPTPCPAPGWARGRPSWSPAPAPRNAAWSRRWRSCGYEDADSDSDADSGSASASAGGDQRTRRRLLLGLLILRWKWWLPFWRRCNCCLYYFFRTRSVCILWFGVLVSFLWLWVSGELAINRETKVCGVECGCFWVNSGQCTAENLGFSENWSRNKFERRAVPSRVAVKPQLNPCQRFCSDGREEAAQQQRRGSGGRRSVLKMESKRVCATGKAAGGGGEEWKGERVRRAGGVVAMEWQSLYIYICTYKQWPANPVERRDENPPPWWSARSQRERESGSERARAAP